MTVKAAKRWKGGGCGGSFKQALAWRPGAILFASSSWRCRCPAQQIDDIVVTVRKREENLQDVPLLCPAFSAEDLQRRGVENAYDLALFTPNFNTQKQVGRTLDRPTVRGMANSSTQGEPNASYFIDGVFVSSSVASATTNTIERIEVGVARSRPSSAAPCFPAPLIT